MISGYQKKTRFIAQFLFLFPLLVAACQSSNQDQEATKASIQKSPEAVTEPISERKEPVSNPIAQPVSESTKIQLNKVVKPAYADSLILFINGFHQVLTDVQLAAHWKRGKKVFAYLEKQLNARNADGYEVMESLEPLENAFAVRPGCDAECTVFTLEYLTDDLRKLAEFTEGEADDQFFDMLESIQSERLSYHKSWLNSFARTWDYGGGSLLGDSTCYHFLEASFNYLKTNSYFRADLLENRKHLLSDMNHPIYMYPTKQVLAELNRILQAGILFPEERLQLLELRKRILSGTPEIQFNCSDPDASCDFGG